MSREYPKAEIFRPERFLDKGMTAPPVNPELYAFGFGRRFVTNVTFDLS